MIGSLVSGGSSNHFEGKGRKRFTFLLGVRQVGTGHLKFRGFEIKIQAI